MTRKRFDSNSTEFGLWLREQSEIDSSLGFVATNVDYVWRNYKTGEWMLIEEKRFGRKPRFYQEEIFQLLDWCARHHPKYHGFHVLSFENTNPEDGRIYLDDSEIIKEQLIQFLRFEIILPSVK